MKLPIERNVLVTLVLIIVVLAFGVIVLTKEPTVDPSTFISRLSQAQTVVLVQDLRATDDQDIRKNIQQCGVDFAGSPALAQKELLLAAYEGNSCVTVSGTKSLSECEAEFAPYIKIVVHAGDQTVFYKDRMAVGVGQTYVHLDCRINKV